MGVAVAGRFRVAGASLLALAPFPIAARRTGRADLPHPALSKTSCFRPRTDADITVAGLIALLELGDKRLAIEVNEEVVPRSQYRNFVLGCGDRVEIVQAIGGG